MEKSSKLNSGEFLLREACFESVDVDSDVFVIIYNALAFPPVVFVIIPWCVNFLCVLGILVFFGSAVAKLRLGVLCVGVVKLLP
mmetsp:Transcript_20101/g.25452  ORF Transcript_20101/g.25452 Transcript_20101/m.25452 type:complete len:84 (-) Transcript_20101:286-537(-)